MRRERLQEKLSNWDGKRQSLAGRAADDAGDYPHMTCDPTFAFTLTAQSTTAYSHYDNHPSPTTRCGGRATPTTNNDDRKVHFRDTWWRISMYNCELYREDARIRTRKRKGPQFSGLCNGHQCLCGRIVALAG